MGRSGRPKLLAVGAGAIVGIALVAPAATADPPAVGDPATRTLAGRVADARGRPLRACVVAHYRTTGTSPSPNSIRGNAEALLNDTTNPGHGAITASDGTFALEVRPGIYDFWVGDAEDDPASPEVCSSRGHPRRFATHFEVVDALLDDPPFLDVELLYLTNNGTGNPSVQPGHDVVVAFALPEDLEDARAFWRDDTSGVELALEPDHAFSGFLWWVGRFPDPGDRPDGPYPWTAWVEDTSNAPERGVTISEVTTGTYTVDRVPPSVYATQPAEGAQGVASDGLRVRVWTDPDAWGLISSAHVYDVSGSERVLVDGTPRIRWLTEVEDGSGEFDHLVSRATYQLLPGTAYEVDLVIRDRARNETHATISFSTGEA